MQFYQYIFKILKQSLRCFWLIWLKCLILKYYLVSLVSAIVFSLEKMAGSSSSNDPSLGMKIALTGIQKKFSEVLQISTDQVYSMWLSCNSNKSSASNQLSENVKNNYVLLDVRESNEREISYIKDSVWIDSDQDIAIQVENAKTAISNKLKELNTSESNQTVKDFNVIAYCSIGYRSSNLIRHLLKTDFSLHDSPATSMHMYNLDGSLFKWANEGKPMVDTNQTSTEYVHPYNKVWGKLLNEKLRKYSK